MSRRLSPIDIQHAEFSRSVGGYDRREVRALLERLSVEVEDGLREAQALRRQLEAAEARVDELKVAEAELQRTVLAAERVAADMKELARKEADMLLQEAEAQKESRLRAASEDVQAMQAQLSRMEHQRALFKEQFRGLLQAHLAGLDAVTDPPPLGGDGEARSLDSEQAQSALLDDTVQP